MDERYIKCSGCQHRTMESRHNSPCLYCKNTGFMLDYKLIFCNLCGEDLTIKHPTKKDQNLGKSGVQCEITGEYSSYYLFDNVTYGFNFCDKCIRTMFSSFKIPPAVKDNQDMDYTYEQDNEDFLFNEYKSNGTQNSKYLEQKCNVDISCQNKAKYTLLDKYATEQNISNICACQDHYNCPRYSCRYYHYNPFIPDHLKSFI